MLLSYGACNIRKKMSGTPEPVALLSLSLYFTFSPCFALTDMLSSSQGRALWKQSPPQTFPFSDSCTWHDTGKKAWRTRVLFARLRILHDKQVTLHRPLLQTRSKSRDVRCDQSRARMMQLATFIRTAFYIASRLRQACGRKRTSIEKNSSRIMISFQC